MERSLLDRIWSVMTESGRAWSSPELAREFLHLKDDGPFPDLLVRRILALDGRFREGPGGQWSARPAARSTLADGEYLLSWVETGGAAEPGQWRLHLAPYSRSEGPSPGTMSLAADRPEDWEAARAAQAGRRIVTYQPGLLQRLRQWLERVWALPDSEDPPLDLLSWVRAALVEEGVKAAESLEESRLPALSRRWSLGPLREEPPGAPLPTIGAILDRLLELQGAREEEEILRRAREVLATRPVPWDGFAFSRAEVEAVPDASGIYRFFGHAGELLYVGKSMCLSRRLGSYFRPLPPEATKREELLRLIRSFEIQTTPSDLEALVLETRTIRLERPPWNVQVEVHPLEVLPPAWWWPVVFVAPGNDPHRCSVFLLRGAADGVLFHLPREGGDEEAARLAEWLDPFLGAAENAGDCPGATPLDPPEIRLVLRYYLRLRDACHRVDSVHFSSGFALAEALLRLARGETEGLVAVDFRPAAGEGG